MDCPPHLWDIDQRSLGVCRQCGDSKQFPRPGEHPGATWSHRTQTKATLQAPPVSRKPNGRPPGESGYRGVTRHPTAKGWVVKYKVGGKQIYVGAFADPVTAAKAYNRALIEHGGDKARLNKV